MSNRTTYHVIPHEDGWAGMMEGAVRASITGKNKQYVIEHTISLAKNREPSSVVIHKTDGAFQEERTYGFETHPPGG